MCGLQRWETAAEGDSNMRLLQKGDILQLERKGYYIVDEAYLRPGKAMVLFNIPDGRQTPLKKPTPSRPCTPARHTST
jgi:glutamyl-tRNA synthetase